MDRHLFWIACFLVGVFCSRVGAEAEPPPPPQKKPAHPLIAAQRFDEIIKRAAAGSQEAAQLIELYAEDFPHVEMARIPQAVMKHLLNTIKRASQRETRAKARQELDRWGVPMIDVVEVLTLDEWLTNPDPVVRYRAAAQLAEWNSDVRIVTVENLKNLIAAESHPDLKWMHAVALSSIESKKGSALEILNSIPDNADLRTKMQLNQWTRFPIKRSPNERAISEITLSNEDYVKLIQRLRTGRLADPTPHPMIANYLSPAPTKLSPGSRVVIAQNGPKERLGGTVSGRFVLGNVVPSDDFDPPPPPPKTPAHPLIASQRFDEILKQAAAGSQDAARLIELYSEYFPQEEMAKKYVPRALDFLDPGNEQALRILRLAGPDAQHVVALEAAQFNQSLSRPEKSTAEYVAILSRIDSPGPYTQEALKLWRKSIRPPVRIAVIEAMSRSPEMQGLMQETLRDSLISQDPAMKQAALETLKRLEIENPVTKTWLEDQVLTTVDLDRLSDVVFAMKSAPGSGEFQEEVLKRIQSEKSAKIQIELIQCLQNHAAPNSEKHRKLSDLKQAILNTQIREMQKQLVSDLRAMIEGSRTIKKQIAQEALEQLNNLLAD